MIHPLFVLMKQWILFSVLDCLGWFLWLVDDLLFQIINFDNTDTATQCILFKSSLFILQCTFAHIIDWSFPTQRLDIYICIRVLIIDLFDKLTWWFKVVLLLSRCFWKWVLIRHVVPIDHVLFVTFVSGRYGSRDGIEHPLFLHVCMQDPSAWLVFAFDVDIWFRGGWWFLLLVRVGRCSDHSVALWQVGLRPVLRENCLIVACLLLPAIIFLLDCALGRSWWWDFSATSCARSKCVIFCLPFICQFLSGHIVTWSSNMMHLPKCNLLAFGQCILFLYFIFWLPCLPNVILDEVFVSQHDWLGWWRLAWNWRK